MSIASKSSIFINALPKQTNTKWIMNQQVDNKNTIKMNKMSSILQYSMNMKIYTISSIGFLNKIIIFRNHSRIKINLPSKMLRKSMSKLLIMLNRLDSCLNSIATLLSLQLQKDLFIFHKQAREKHYKISTKYSPFLNH